jgi:hypothetical protein
MVLAPGAFLRLSGREVPTPVSVLLMRTIGIRDVVLGAGTVAAAHRGSGDDLLAWNLAGLGSDSLDVAASLAAGRSIGRAESMGAAGAALAFVLGDLVARRGLLPGRPSPRHPGELAG